METTKCTLAARSPVSLWITWIKNAYFNAVFISVFKKVQEGIIWKVEKKLVFSHLVTDHQSYLLLTLNPFSHCLFCVSRLTAICHLWHPLKADLGKKWRRFWCLCVCPSTRTHPAKWSKTERRRQIFMFFAITSAVGLRFEFWKDWLNPQRMLIPNLFGLSKGFKSS